MTPARPVVVGLAEYSAHEPCQRRLGREAPHHAGAAPDLAVAALLDVVGAHAAPVRLGEVEVGQRVGLGGAHPLQGEAGLPGGRAEGVCLGGRAGDGAVHALPRRPVGDPGKWMPARSLRILGVSVPNWVSSGRPRQPSRVVPVASHRASASASVISLAQASASSLASPVIPSSPGTPLKAPSPCSTVSIVVPFPRAFFLAEKIPGRGPRLPKSLLTPHFATRSGRQDLAP